MNILFYEQTVCKRNTKTEKGLLDDISSSVVIVKVGLVWFYGISIIEGYLKPNPLYTYISNIYMICKHIL